MSPKRRRTKLAVGDTYISPHGRTMQITGIDVQAMTITVNVERTVITRDGELTTDTRERVVPKERWSRFAQAYKKTKPT